MKTQSAVNYREGDADASCSTCAFFESPESCAQVGGVISPAGICDLHMPAGAEAGATPAPMDQVALEQMLLGGGI